MLALELMPKRTPASVLLAKLSEREVEVFTRLARGERASKIGRDLSLHHATVTTYRCRILAKLGLSTIADIVLVAHAAGLTKPPRIPK